MYEDICHIGRDMTQNGIFGNGETFCPSLPSWTILSKLSAYNWLYNVICQISSYTLLWIMFCKHFCNSRLLTSL